MRESIFCKHYRAMSDNTTCKAGVEYDSFKGLKFDKRPCFAKLVGKGYVSPGGCELEEFPTKEEIAEQDEFFRQRMAKTFCARQAIEDHISVPWKKGVPGASGEIPCPVCETGTLGYSRAGYNGHIHAACTTDDCVRWME